MMDIKKGYKVVQTNDADYEYCSPITRTWEGGVEFKVGEFVKRKDNCGPLCVFTCEYDAKLFVKREGSGNRVMAVFTCDYTPSSEKQLYTTAFGPNIFNVCDGTDFADAVKLKERVPMMWWDKWYWER